jgi:flagellar biosynthetic protein FlhB
MAGDNRTEQPTPRRRQKAREQGRVARSRELSATLALAGMLAVAASGSATTMRGWRQLLRVALNTAATSELHLNTALLPLVIRTLAQAIVPALVCGWVLAAASSVAQGGFVLAPAAWMPSLQRLSPARRLGHIFSLSSLSDLLKSLLPFAAILYCSAAVLSREWQRIRQTSQLNPGALAAFLGGCVVEVLWKSVLLLLVWAAVDYWLVRRKHEADLRMSREEIRRESKENDGNPSVKAKIRRLQQQARRRRAVQDVANATVVVTNPTHYAVALEYRPPMEAPKVISKGRNLLARQIKERARWHGIPVLENPPLAQALYRSVEVGQSIPANFYAAVAELLAFVYRAQRRAAGGML